jgi:hypothetical protein
MSALVTNLGGHYYFCNYHRFYAHWQTGSRAQQYQNYRAQGRHHVHRLQEKWTQCPWLFVERGKQTEGNSQDEKRH